MAQTVKNPPAMQETWVRFLDWEDPLEKGKEFQNNCNILAWRIPWTEEPGRLQSMGLQSQTLQYSGLEDSMDRGAWQATVHGVAKSQT